MINTRVIGIGEFRISAEQTGIIDVQYVTTRSMTKSGRAIGSGRARGDTSKGFTGDYRVQYYDAAGKFTGDLDLHIAPIGDSYQLNWRHRPENVRLPVNFGEVVYEGIGFLTSQTSMAVAYWMSKKVSSAIEFKPLLWPFCFAGGRNSSRIHNTGLPRRHHRCVRLCATTSFATQRATNLSLRAGHIGYRPVQKRM